MHGWPVVFTASEQFFGAWNLGEELLDIYHTELIVFWQNIKCGKSVVVVIILVHRLAFWAIVGTGGPRRQIRDQMYVYGLAPWGHNWGYGPYRHIRKPIFVHRSTTDANKYQNKFPKGSQIECCLQIVVHSVEYSCRFLKNSEYATRSCLCSPNSFPSIPDTPQSEPKTHPRTQKHELGCVSTLSGCLLQIWSPQQPTMGPMVSRSPICKQLFGFGLSPLGPTRYIRKHMFTYWLAPWKHSGRHGAQEAHP